MNKGKDTKMQRQKHRKTERQKEQKTERQQGLRISQSVTKLKEPEVDEVLERQPKVLATE